MFAARLRILNEPSEHDCAAVFNQNVGADGSLVSDEVYRAAAGRRDARTLLLDFQHHRIALVDLRRDLEDRSHFLTLDRLEGIELIACIATACARVLAGDEGHFLRNLDLRLLIVHGDDRGRGDDVSGRVPAQGAKDGSKVDAAGAESAHTQRSTPRNCRESCRIVHGSR